ncbi:MAG: CARDB domain-containing protein [Thermodesulfovibrionales bacterium]
MREPWKDIYVLIDPQNNIAETNETNNTASKRFTIGASVDLSVSSDGITFNPTNPREGDTVEISARVNNTGYGQPQNVLVRFYLGDPKLGGTQIGSDIVIPSIQSVGSSAANISWTIPTATGGNLHNASVLQDLKTLLKIQICDLKYGIIFCMKYSLAYAIIVHYASGGG